MSILFFLLLILLVLPLWLFLATRIWRVSPAGARATFLLIVPTYFWAAKHWNDREIALRPALAANLFSFFLLVLVGYKAFEFEIQSVFLGRDYAQEKQRAKSPVRTSSEWERWCKENNDATYDPTLGTCVENGKEEALARSESRNVFGRLVQHFEKSGIKGEFDESASAGALLPQLATPEIAKVTPYYFLPLSMSQPTLAVLLCVSEAACLKYEENARERGTVNLVRNANLLLVLPTAGADEARINMLTTAFLRFKST